tara:strand:- start:11317 stop:12072 length:756 start_codon:yes stop_codon:yes gene_type:complete
MKKIKVLALIPTRLGSTRLLSKPLLEIRKIPLIVHTYKRTELSKLVNDIHICCDHKSIKKVAKNFGANVLLTSKKHKNGTERIGQAYGMIKKKYDFIIDVQGDEPLIDPNHIDQVVKFHKKNPDIDIVLPTLKLKNINTKNVVKVVTDNFDNVIYLSRAEIPFQFKKKNEYFLKHLSIISFKPSALKKFCLTKPTKLEMVEGIELLRAIEINLKIKTIVLKGDSFSVDIKDDYVKAKQKMKKDKFFKLYKI